MHCTQIQNYIGKCLELWASSLMVSHSFSVSLSFALSFTWVFFSSTIYWIITSLSLHFLLLLNLCCFSRVALLSIEVILLSNYLKTKLFFSLIHIGQIHRKLAVYCSREKCNSVKSVYPSQNRSCELWPTQKSAVHCSDVGNRVYGIAYRCESNQNASST